MTPTSHRLLAGSAATLAALALAAAPALAGEDDGDDDDSGDSVTQVQPAPAPAASSGGGDTAGAVPQGGIATGAGGTAPQGPGAVLLGLASGALVLLATGGGLTAAARRDGR